MASEGVTGLLSGRFHACEDIEDAEDRFCGL